MPRRPRQLSEAGYYHFITRGINKKKLFHAHEDYLFYLKLLGEYCLKLEVKIYHYCLMTNHAHILLKAPNLEILSQYAHFTHRRYCYYYCKTYRWSGQVFRRNYISLPVEEDSYLLECGRYIERNPLKAGLVKALTDYPYSSYHHYAHGRKDLLITESILYADLGFSLKQRQATYRFYVTQPRIKELELEVPF